LQRITTPSSLSVSASTFSIVKELSLDIDFVIPPKIPLIQPARRQTVVKIKCFFFIFDYILNFMQIYEKRKYNTKKIRKIKYIFVTVTTHTLGCSG